MIYNILQYLEEAEKKFPQKVALEDEFESFTYEEYVNKARVIGTFVANKVGGGKQRPVAVLIDRNIKSICAFIGNV